jgi:hypothetical protein
MTIRRYLAELARRSTMTPAEVAALPAMITRSFRGYTPNTARDDDRSVEWLLSTEEPIDVFDWQRGDIIGEVLVSSGIEIPANGQVVLLDSHDRGSNQAVLGSCREIRVTPSGVVGRLYFSRKQRAVDAWNDVQDGHQTDGSVGYEPIEWQDVEAGQSYVVKTATGERAYQGPVRITRRWKLKEFSLPPIGADPAAKARAEVAPQPSTHSAIRAESKTGGTFAMNPKLYALLILRGLATGSTDEQALAFLAALPPADQDSIRAEAAKPEQKTAPAPQVDVAARVAAESKRNAEIVELCRAANVVEIASSLFGKTEAEVMAGIRAAIPTKPATPVIVGGPTDKEKFRAAASHGMMARYGKAPQKPAAGFEDFVRMNPMRMAEECLRNAGVNTRHMSSMEIAGAALGLSTRGAYPIAGTTADFPLILANVAENMLMKGFSEATPIWNRIARIVNRSDFKLGYESAISNSPDIDLIDEAGEYKEAKFNEKQESGRVYPFGKRWTITRQMVVNDKIDAFLGTPEKFGAACPRKVDELLLNLLIANAALTDGTALFAAARGNYTSGAGGALSGTTLSAAIAAMQDMKGFGEDTEYLNITPAIWLGPSALGFTARVELGSTGNTTASANSGVLNPNSGLGIDVITHARLSANSTTRWYLLANPQQYDTLAALFLDGVTTPMLETVDQTDVDGRIFKVRFDCGAMVLSPLGMRMNDGA